MKKNFLFFLSFCLLGCATVSFNQQQTAAVLQEGRAVFGEATDFEVFLVPSRGALADATFVAQSVSSGPSVLARELAGRFKAGAEADTRLVVAGPASAKTRQVIKDAFRLNRRRQLPRLKLLFMGDVEEGREVERMARTAGAEYFFKEAPMR